MTAVTLAVLTTDGRRECIQQTVASATENLQGATIADRIIFTDSDPAYRAWLTTMFPQWWVVSTGEKRGYAAAMHQAFMRLSTHDRPVVWCEDDWLFNRPVPVHEMVDCLLANPRLAQIVLRRQPVNSQEIAAGGVVEQHPDWYEDAQLWDGYGMFAPGLVHSGYWSNNVCVVAPWVFDVPYPESEGLFTFALKEARHDVLFAYWGERHSAPWIHHIGDVRTGAHYG